jgi:anaerobic nitric oxide reductase transcription regulator
MVDAAHLDLRAPAASGVESPPVESPRPTPELPLAERIARFERDTILDAVARHGGNWAAAARELGVHRSNLHHRARRLGLR